MLSQLLNDNTCIISHQSVLRMLTYGFHRLDKSGYQVIIFLISPRKRMLWYSLEEPRRGASMNTTTYVFMEKNTSTFGLIKASIRAMEPSLGTHVIL